MPNIKNENVKPKVKLTNEDGNAFAILGRVSKALRDNGQLEKVKEFQLEATSGDYNHLLQTCFKYCEIE